jgi:hypothetical protein
VILHSTARRLLTDSFSPDQYSSKSLVDYVSAVTYREANCHARQIGRATHASAGPRTYAMWCLIRSLIDAVARILGRIPRASHSHRSSEHCWSNAVAAFVFLVMKTGQTRSWRRQIQRTVGNRLSSIGLSEDSRNPLKHPRQRRSNDWAAVRTKSYHWGYTPPHRTAESGGAPHVRAGLISRHQSRRPARDPTACVTVADARRRPRPSNRRARGICRRLRQQE